MPVDVWKCLRKTCAKQSFANPGIKKRFCPCCNWPCVKVNNPPAWFFMDRLYFGVTQ